MSFGDIAGQFQGSVGGATEFVNNSNNSFLSPKNARGIHGWEFDVSGTENISLTADVTDHYTENNSYINDHVVRKPVRITLTGYIGELVFKRPEGFQNGINEITNRLSVVDAYLGDYLPQQKQEVDKVLSESQKYANKVNQIAGKVKNIVGLVGSPFGSQESKQAKAFNDLKALFVGENADGMPLNSLVTVQTPWQFYEDMIITNLSFTQNEDSKDISDISVTLKQLRFAEIETTNFDETLFPPRENVQGSEAVDSGPVQGESGELQSTLSSAYEAGVQ